MRNGLSFIGWRKPKSVSHHVRDAIHGKGTHAVTFPSERKFLKDRFQDAKVLFHVDAKIVGVKPDVEDGILERRESHLVDHSLQPFFFKALQTWPVRPEKTARTDITQAARFKDFVPANDSVPGNVYIGICHACHAQTKRPFPARNTPVHPSPFGTAVAVDSRVKESPCVRGVYLIARKDNRLKLNPAARCDGNGTVEIGFERLDGLSRFQAVMVRESVCG